MGEMPDMGEMPNMGEMPDMSEMSRPGGMNGMQMPFTESGDTITLTLNEDIVNTLTVDAIVQITFGDNGSVQSLTPIGGKMQDDFGGDIDFSNMMPPADTDNSDS